MGATRLAPSVRVAAPNHLERAKGLQTAEEVRRGLDSRGHRLSGRSVLPGDGLPGGLQWGPWEAAAGQRCPALPPLASPQKSLSSHSLAAAVTPPLPLRGFPHCCMLVCAGLIGKTQCAESKHRNPPAWPWCLLSGSSWRLLWGVPNPSLPACPAPGGCGSWSRDPASPHPGVFRGSAQGRHQDDPWPLIHPLPVPGERRAQCLRPVHVPKTESTTQSRSFGGTRFKVGKLGS